MKKSRYVGAAALVSLCLAFSGGCADTVDDIDRTRGNILPKSLFEGEWYFARTTIDAPYETSGTFVGDRQEYTMQGDFPASKIRWRIEEDKLFACRADEVVEGAANSPGHEVLNEDGSDYIKGEYVEGEEDLSLEEAGKVSDETGKKFPCRYPLAAFRIESHFDITREYNSATGEQSNVISENTSDRQWYDREYMRVDWSDLGVTDLNFNINTQAMFGWLGIENVYYVQAETNDCRKENEDGTIDYSECEEGYLPPIIEYDENGKGTDILITNRMTMVPEDGFWACYVTSVLGYGTPCTLAEIGMRYSFHRVPDVEPESQYEELYYPDEMFERFGTWRVEKPYYLDGYGETDLKNYRATRFNLWEKTKKCDENGENCTSLPLSERTVKPIDYYLNREFARDLIPTAFQIAKDWSDAYVGIHPSITEEGCKVKCGDNKDFKDCTAEDTNWRMEGLCVFNLHENNGSQFMGDLRYNFIAHIEDNGLEQPCGVGGPANDPETGELINATAYVYGNCFDYYETRVADFLDIICEQKLASGVDPADLPKSCTNPIDENVVMRGFNFLDIVREQGRVKPPSTPIYTITAPDRDYRGPNTSKDASWKLQEKLERLKLDARNVQQNRSLLLSRANRLAAEGLDRLLISDVVAKEISGGRAATAYDLTDDEVSIISPLNRGASKQAQLDAKIDALAARAVEPAEYLFNDSAIWAFIMAHKDLTRAELMRVARLESFRATALHELGHNQGMRHNFRGTFDRAHFFKEYWEIRDEAKKVFAERYGRAPMTSFKIERDPETAAEEAEFLKNYKQWNEDKEALRLIEHELNIVQTKYSSIMDYNGQAHGDWESGLGSYDKAFMRFLYANLVDEPPCAYDVPIEKCYEQGKLHNSKQVQYYLGGERCSSDADCPHAADGQKCRMDESGNNVKLCSNWYTDKGGKKNPYIYQFCSDERVEDDPFCNRFDFGESAEEIIRSMIESYENLFVFNAFRRYRSGFSARGYYSRVFNRHFRLIGDMMQSVLYKYFYEEGFKSIDGPGGWDDMIRAVIIGFEFLGNVIMRPESGTFTWDRNLKMFTQQDDRLTDAPNSEKLINIPLGQGRPAYSSYENGYYGEINRLAFVGHYYDKLAAIETLTQRYWGASNLSNENRFYLNFFDFLPSSFNKLIGSIVANDMLPISNYFDIDEGVLVQRNYWDGRDIMSDDEGGFGSALDAELTSSMYPVQGGAGFYTNLYSVMYGAMDVAYYSDTSFADLMRVFELGSGTGFDISNIDADDYELCVSPLSHRTFAAVQNTQGGGSIGVRAINYCNQLVDRYNELVSADPQDPSTYPADVNSLGDLNHDLTYIKSKISSMENAMNNIIYINSVLGVGRL